jgi:hypothetical protein
MVSCCDGAGNNALRGTGEVVWIALFETAVTFFVFVFDFDAG